ncbi:MAG TPA: Uma2 family endonuclease [Roseiflexaceae bacterium]|nr:Uma2 family endonuclease [Roseiflexaceae bacterium]
MTALHDAPVTAQEYFALDARSEARLEFYAGVVVAQVGASARHNLIVSNLIGHLYPQVRQSGCRIFPSDMRVQAIDQRVYTYPDCSIVCGPPRYAEPAELKLLHPVAIIEILSPSAEGRDTRDKLQGYRTISSLHEYVLVAQHAPYVQRYVRQDPLLWHVHLTDDLGGRVTLETIGYSLPMQAIYDGITF